MKKQTKILFISQEIDPYVNETELAMLCRKVPQYAQDHGTEIRVFMPCYGQINERRNQLHEVQRLSGVNIIIDDNDHPQIMKVASIPTIRVQVYFIDNDDYFQRKGIWRDAAGQPFEDNDERSMFFVRGVLETIKRMRWTPDIILCSGWITALAPMYIKQSYYTEPFISHAKVVYSICQERISSPLHEGVGSRLMFDGLKSEDWAEMEGKDELTSDLMDRMALRYADAAIAETEEVPECVMELIRERELPFLDYSDSTPGERHYRFFEQICPAFSDEE